MAQSRFGGVAGEALEDDDRVHGRVSKSRLDGPSSTPTLAPWSPRSSTRTPGSSCRGSTSTDITYHRAGDHGTVRIAFDRPEVRNAFRPHTVDELYRALDHARSRPTSAACSSRATAPRRRTAAGRSAPGGDQRIRGKDGYKYARAKRPTRSIRPAGRLHILEVQRLIRFMPKVVIASSPAGRSAAATACTSSAISRSRAGARPLQADRPRRRELRQRLRLRLPRPPGGPEERARDLLPRRGLLGRGSRRMGMVNAVVPHAELERVALEWGARSTPRARPRCAC